VIIIWNHKLLNLVLAQTCFVQSRQLPCTTKVGPVFALPEPYTLFPRKLITAHPAQYIPGVLIVVLLAAFFIGSNSASLGLFFLVLCQPVLVGAATDKDRQFLHMKAMSSVFFSYLSLLITNWLFLWRSVSASVRCFCSPRVRRDGEEFSSLS